MKCATAVMSSTIVRPVDFSTLASNQAGVSGSKNETTHTGLPPTVSSPSTRALLTDAQNGCGCAVHGVERVGRARGEALVPDERLQGPPDTGRARHRGSAAWQVEARRE